MFNRNTASSSALFCFLGPLAACGGGTPRTNDDAHTSDRGSGDAPGTSAGIETSTSRESSASAASSTSGAGGSTSAASSTSRDDATSGHASSGGATSTDQATSGEVTSSQGGTSPSTDGTSTDGGTGSSSRPSPGCAKAAGRPSGGKVYKAGESWLLFPEKYDGTTPLPVLFGFHGCGAYNFGDAQRTEFYDVTRGSRFETDYVIVAPLAKSGSCFDYAIDIVRAKAVYDDLVSHYCVDLNRVFGTGHSSGAGFLTSMLAASRKADFDHFAFKGMAPVSAWDMEFSTQVPMMYIQGVTDSERGGGNGQSVVDAIVDANQCSTTTNPYPVDACNSDHDNDPVNAGCKSYDGCDVPTVWCSHDDSVYGGTFHGIPCFYQQAVYDFFAGL